MKVHESLSSLVLSGYSLARINCLSRFQQHTLAVLPCFLYRMLLSFTKATQASPEALVAETLDTVAHSFLLAGSHEYAQI